MRLTSRLGEGALLAVGTYRSAAGDFMPALRRTLTVAAREEDALHVELAGLDADAVREQLAHSWSRTVRQFRCVPAAA